MVLQRTLKKLSKEPTNYLGTQIIWTCFIMHCTTDGSDPIQSRTTRSVTTLIADISQLSSHRAVGILAGLFWDGDLT